MKKSNNRAFKNPFRIIPGHRFVFASAHHKQCFEWLNDGLGDARPLSLLTGRPGSGKTTLLKAVGERAGTDTKSLFCFSSALDAEQLLAFLAGRLQAEVKEASDIRSVEDFVTLAGTVCDPGTILLILIDEAQNLEDSALDLLLRIADQAKAGKGRFVTVVAGGPELEGRWSVTAAAHSLDRDLPIRRLGYLDEEEVGVFIQEQLRQQDVPEHTFSDSATKRVSELTGGAPRMVNNLASKAIFLAHLSGDRVVTQNHVEESVSGVPIEQVDLSALAKANQVAEAPASISTELEKETLDPEKVASAPAKPLPHGSEMRNQEATRPTKRDSRPFEAGAGTVTPSEPTESLPNRDDEATSQVEIVQRLRIDSEEAPHNLRMGSQPGMPGRSRRGQWIAMTAGLMAAVAAGLTFEAHRSGNLQNMAKSALSLSGLFSSETGDDGRRERQDGAIVSTPASDEQMEQWPDPPTVVAVSGLTEAAVAGTQSRPSVSMFAAVQAPPISPTDDIEQALTQIESPGSKNLSSDVETDSGASEVAKLLAEVKQIQRGGDYAEAFAAVEEGLEAHPDNPELRRLRGELVAELEESRENTRIDASVTKLEKRARAQRNAGDHLGALVTIAEALRYRPEKTELIVLRDEIAAAHEQDVERERVEQKIATLTHEARASLETAEYLAAKAKIGEALALDPDNTDLLAMRETADAELEAARLVADEQARQIAEVAALREQALTLQAQNDYEAALEKAEAALKLAPEDAAVMALWSELDEQFAAQQERERIAVEIAQLSEGARRQLAAEDYEGAESALSEALSLAPGDGELEALRAEIEARKQAALEQQRIALEVSRLVGEARNHQAAGDHLAGIDKIDRALALIPEDRELGVLREELQAQHRAVLERERIATEVARLANEARVALEAEDYTSALERTAAGLERRPEDPELLALGEEIEGARRAAEEQARRVAEVERLQALAKTQSESGDHEGALASVEAALELAADDAELEGVRGELIAVQAAALEQRKRVAEVAALREQALTLQAQNDYEAALEKAEAALKLAPEDAAVMALWSELDEQFAAQQERERIAVEVAQLSEGARRQLAAEDYEGAESALSEALSLAPGDGELEALRAEIEARKQAALEQQRIALEVSRLVGEARNHQAAGDHLAGIDKIDRALALIPEDRELGVLREELQAQHRAVLERERIATEVARLANEARVALEAEDYTSALERTAAGLERRPEDPELLALGEEIEGARRAAEEQARRVAEVERLQALAKTQSESGDHEGALASVEAALELAADDAELEGVRGELIAVQAAALEQRKRVAEVAALREQALTLQAQNDYEAALEKAEAALKLAPEDAAVMALWSELDEQFAAQQERERIAVEIAQLSEGARRQLAAEDYEGAESALSEALSLAPGDGELEALRAEIEARKQAALEQQRIALEVSRLVGEARNHQAAGDHLAGIDKIDRALALIPEDRELGVLREELQAQHRAVLERERIATEVARLANEARVALEAEDYTTALARTAAGLEQRPEDPELLALGEEIEGARLAAAEQARRIAEMERLQALAKTQSESGDHEGALASIEAALDLAPGDGGLLGAAKEIKSKQLAELERERLAQRAEKLGDEAREALEVADFAAATMRVDKALDLAPDDSNLNALRTEIQQARHSSETRRLSTEAEQALAVGEYQRALDAADAGLSLAPDDTTLIALKGEIEQQQATALEQERVGNEVTRLSEAARVALTAGQYETALEKVNAALVLALDHEPTLALKEDIVEGQRAAKEQRRLDSEVVRLRAEARDALRAENYELALEKTAAGLEIAAEDPELLALQKNVTAQQQEALERRNTSAKFAELIARAQDLQKAGDFSAALESVDEARRLIPEDPRLEALRIQLVAQQRAADDLQARVNRVEELKRAADSQQSSGNLEAALDSVDEALKLKPDDQDLTAMRATIRARQRAKAEKAEIDERIAALTQRALGMRAEGNYDGALSALQEVISLAPEQQAGTELYSQIYEERRLAVAEQRREQELAELTQTIAEHIQNAEYDAGARLVQVGLDKFPEESRLTALRDRIETLSASEPPSAATLETTPTVDIALPQISADLDPQVAMLVESGNARMRLRDISAARLFFEAAVEAGSLRTAISLGMTYDPLVLRQLKVIGARGDSKKALYWYEMAREAGDTEAESRIEALRGR